MRRFVHLALPLVVFGLGLAAGAWFSIGRRAANFTAGVEQRLAAPAPARPAPIADAKRAFPSIEEMLTALMSAVADEEPLRRAHRLHDLLGRLNSAELAALFAHTVQVDDRDRREVMLAPLLRRWAALDPAAAAAAVRPYLDRFRAPQGSDWLSLETSVAQAWAKALPDSALAEALATPHAAWAQRTAWSALEALAEGDPTRQLAALANLPASGLRDDMCDRAIESLAEKDSAAAEAALRLLSDPRRRARVQAEILGKLAERDPAAGLARLAALAPELKPGTAGMQLVTKILRAAAKQDAASALAAVDGLPEELQTSARGAALVGWAGEHPVDALAWAADHGVDVADAKVIEYFGDNGGNGWNSLVSIAFGSDPAQTLAWLRTQPASPERDAMLRQGIWRVTAEEKFRIYAELTPAGRAEAAGDLVRSAFENGTSDIQQWVKTQPPGAARKSAIWWLAYYQVSNVSESIETAADAWPAGSDRDAALSGMVLFLAQNDPRRALEIARRVSGASARETVFESVASSWSYRDEPAARAWVSSAPEFSAEQKRVLLRQFDER